MAAAVVSDRNAGFLRRCIADLRKVDAAEKGRVAQDYAREIYNQDHDKADRDFAGGRPLDCAKLLSGMLAPRKAAVRLTDYGGGIGIFARRMNQSGFEAYSYDPFFQSGLPPPAGERFEPINCREVIEHAPDPHAFARDVLRLLADDAAIFFSTCTQPENIEQIGLAWEYVSPSNGHISLHSTKSLATLWSACACLVSQSG